MTEMLAFTRRQGEGINALIARYETIRLRAATEGNFTMSVEGQSLQLLRAIGIQSQHLFTLLQPYQGRLPNTDADFGNLCDQLKRYGHVTEGTRDNIGNALHGPLRQARPGQYFAEDQEAYQGAARASAIEGNMSTYLSHSQGAARQHPWDTLLPAPLDAQAYPVSNPFAQ